MRTKRKGQKMVHRGIVKAQTIERERERENCENHLTVCSSELLLSLTDVMMFTDVHCDVTASSEVLIWQPVGGHETTGLIERAHS